MFVSTGAEAFADRAVRELLATGEKARRRSPDTRGLLTAQETGSRQLAREGYWNPEIGRAAVRSLARAPSSTTSTRCSPSSRSARGISSTVRCPAKRTKPSRPEIVRVASGTLGSVLRPFSQVDVFTTAPYLGNPVAVVLDGTGLTTTVMQRFAHWTNLSETAFVLSPTASGADYRVRIFTPVSELPFAGHPTLGTCHAWLAASGGLADADVVVQQCAAGLVPVRRTGDGLAFAAPPLLRSGPVEESLVRHIASVLRIDRSEIVDAEWADNGPGWVAVLLASADAVLALQPGFVDLDVGVVGPYPPASPQAFEVRAFFPKEGSTVEDPVTGSLNASLAEWLLRTGRATAPYTVSQGTALGRSGRVHILRDDGKIWVAGGTVTCIAGEVEL
jgi:PhzF family phenazine biosynthesis protein